MRNQRMCRWFFFLVLGIILLNPLAYWFTGIGQSAAGLSAQITRLPDGTLVSSPKAEALHRLSLPMQIERWLIYPLLLICFQLSGGALALRRWLEGRVSNPTRVLPSGQTQSFPGGQAQGFPRGRAQGLPLRVRRVLEWGGRLIPHTWRQRLVGHDLIVVLFFVLALDAALAVLYLPFNFYSSFILTHQFGLSVETVSGWIVDWFKSLLITLVIDGLAWTSFYALMRLMPRRWPIPAGALAMLLSAAFVLLTPILITPLFYEVRPLEDTALQARILDLAGRAGMQVDEVYVINASAKTTKANAYFTGFGGAQRIVLYDTQLTQFTPDQVEVVLAHEMGHWYYHHVLLGLLGMGGLSWIGLFGLRWLLSRTWSWLGLAGPADAAGLPYLLAVVALASMLSLPAQNALSRYAEGQADHFALRISQKPAAFTQLFERFAVQNLSPVDAPAWEKFLFYTHPSISERVRSANSYHG